MLRLGNDRHLMGEHRNGHVVNVLAWGMTGLILLIITVLFTVSLP
jgi:Mn2+/Fe2+ NRAMP family transporter